MRIVRQDNVNQTQKVVAQGLTSEQAGKKAVQLAQVACMTMPNEPRVWPCGPDAIGVYIGIYKMYTFSIEAE